MKKSAKVAISLPAHVLQAVEKKRTASGESRSEFFRRAVEKLLKQEQECAAIEKYIRGYREVPESTEEIESADRLASEVLAEEPWN